MVTPCLYLCSFWDLTGEVNNQTAVQHTKSVRHAFDRSNVLGQFAVVQVLIVAEGQNLCIVHCKSIRVCGNSSQCRKPVTSCWLPVNELCLVSCRFSSYNVTPSSV